MAAPRPPPSIQTRRASLLTGVAVLVPSIALPSRAAPTIDRVPQSVSDSLKRRDDAAEFKCKLMFDCDGDRRDYAKAQWANFLARGGKKKPAATPAPAE